MKTLIGHFFNEEYLLPHWLNHHKKYFDHGVLIDYASTDKSVEIIKELCPTWEIRQSLNDDFDARKLDREIMDTEAGISGWRICLNITEFLLGNFNLLNSVNDIQYLIASHTMVDSTETEYTGVKENLLKERTFGINFKKSNDNFRIRRARSLTYNAVHYPTGRHFEHYNTDDFIILWYGFSPFNEETIKRKLQIQTKMSEGDKMAGFGHQHIKTRDALIADFKMYQNKGEDLSDIIKGYLNE